MKRIATVIAAAFVFVSAASAPVIADEPAPAERPNIVMFYIDDVPPHDGRLWNDPARTPAIYDNFVAHGINFDHAIGEDPLCCPARGNMLTGLHTHNNRVTYNNALLFDPSVHIGKSMLQAGYASMFIGKYLNRDLDLTPEQWAEHDAGWTDLDVIKGVNGAFLNYDLHTKTGDFRVNGLHSTQMVADRAIMHFRETPAETPVFAILSIFNLHAPNTPMSPTDIGDPRCAGMPPWNPPNYNEADVSDKPAGIQALPLLPYPDGWPMVRYCEEMLGVDRAVGQVIGELAAEGRLDNTLLVFTADNGMAWGQHRLGQQKIWPYATPLPLYMRWPAGHWGDTPQTESEIVSNIDYAPTFCELAQTCVLGPYARGSAAPDGKSIVGLLNGDVPDLGRDAVLEEGYTGHSWAGLRTTELFDPDNRWHYIEYTDGERELYDLVNDPWELQNLASDPSRAGLIATLHTRLAELHLEGIGAGTGTISIIEDALPDSGNDYSFSGDLGTFTLDDDADTDATYPNTATFTGVPSGTYTISRAAILPWMPAGIDCDGVAATWVAGGVLTVYLHPEETITCRFVDATRQPDASIARYKRGTYKLNNFYSSIAVPEQSVRRKRVKVGLTYDYWVRLQNDGPVEDAFLVGATTTGPGTVQVAFLLDGVDITAGVMSGTYEVIAGAGAKVRIRLRVTIGIGTPRHSPFRVVVTSTSEGDPARVDVVRAVAVR